MTDTFDDKRAISPYGLQAMDEAFFAWWDKKLNIHLDSSGQALKVPVEFATQERWHRARSGVRDDTGKIKVPLILVSRTGESDPPDGPTHRFIADTHQELTIYKEVNGKTSKIANLLASRPSNIDPNLPIYEMQTIPIPDHFSLTYKVGIWTSYIHQMNECIQKIGQEFDYKSRKCFVFKGANNFSFLAFKDDELADESNLEEFTDNERIIRKEYAFTVSAHIIPVSDQRTSPLKRYLTQTKIVIKQETELSEEEMKKLLGE